MWLNRWRCGGYEFFAGDLFQRQRLFLVEEAHQFMKELHAVLFHHHRMRSLAQLDQPLVRRILQLREIALRQIARKTS
jgi:hypothetical protein